MSSDCDPPNCKIALSVEISPHPFLIQVLLWHLFFTSCIKLVGNHLDFRQRGSISHKMKDGSVFTFRRQYHGE